MQFNTWWKIISFIEWHIVLKQDRGLGCTMSQLQSVTMKNTCETEWYNRSVVECSIRARTRPLIQSNYCVKTIWGNSKIFFFFFLFTSVRLFKKKKKKLKTIFNNNSSWQEQNAGWFSSSIDAINSMPAKRSSRRFSSFQLWEITLHSLWSHPLFPDVSHISNACCDVRSKSGNPELTKLSLTKNTSIHMYFKSNLYAVLLTVTVWV